MVLCCVLFGSYFRTLAAILVSEIYVLLCCALSWLTKCCLQVPQLFMEMEVCAKCMAMSTECNAVQCCAVLADTMLPSTVVCIL